MGRSQPDPGRPPSGFFSDQLPDWQVGRFRHKRSRQRSSGLCAYLFGMRQSEAAVKLAAAFGIEARP